MSENGFYLFFNNWRFLIDNADNETIGAVFRAVFKYFADGESLAELETDIMTKNSIYLIIGAMEQSREISRKRAESGKKGGKTTQSNIKGSYAPSYNIEQFEKQSLSEPLIYEKKKK